MPHKTLINIVPVWVAYICAGLINLTADQWIGLISLFKELIGLIAFILAALFTLYKFRKEWRGIDPRSKRKQKQTKE